MMALKAHHSFQVYISPVAGHISLASSVFICLMEPQIVLFVVKRTLHKSILEIISETTRSLHQEQVLLYKLHKAYIFLLRMLMSESTLAFL